MFDHSSLDSLLDPAYPEDDLARQSGTEGGVSLTNLSHDSGLTTSDSQLYAFDGVENNSFSSSDDLRKLSAASSGRFIYLLFACITRFLCPFASIHRFFWRAEIVNNRCQYANRK